jgi:2-C-methyl-D-erythritol 4-phosphate cytidylyltransferase/2-C-methyl-D-erythritol 2,4-cyclodiphosphate synthase
VNISIIILAAGKGERAGLGKNKLLAPLCGAPALYHTINAFKQFDDIIIATSAQDISEVEAIARPFNAKVCLGGETRTKSVYNALQHAKGDIVLIHDGARPFVTRKVIDDCIENVIAFGSAICALPATDTTVICDGNEVISSPERKKVYTVQTPQGFYLKDIKAAYDKAITSDGTFTDDGSVYAAFIGRPHIFIGDRDNIKLTYKSDFDRQYPPVNTISAQAVGIGIDTHAFGKTQNFVTLCGVKIPCDSGLIAHSDGDVAVHAVMDALLSAAGLKDIGHYFPDTDRQYSGADSIQLLKQAVKIVSDAGYMPLNLSVTIQAEKPRLAKYIDEMALNLAAACNLERDKVGVSAGTCEKLGFVGEGLGITATAVTLLTKLQ